MKVYGIEDVLNLNLDSIHKATYCLPRNWQGTVIDLLRAEYFPPEDRLWIASNWIDDRTLRLFAAWCAKRALALVSKPDLRSTDAINVAEQFALGRATKIELLTANAESWTAVIDADDGDKFAFNAAHFSTAVGRPDDLKTAAIADAWAAAARFAARFSADRAARAAARSAWETIQATVLRTTAIESDPWKVIASAIEKAARVSCTAAAGSTWEIQIQHLIEMLEAGEPDTLEVNQ